MKFFTNKISTNSKGDFNKLIEKFAESRKHVKTAQAADAANEDEKVRTDVHSLEGLEKDQNGEPECDGEQKVVDAPSLASTNEEPIKEAQIAPAARPSPSPTPKPSMAPAIQNKTALPQQMVNGKAVAPGVVHAKPIANKAVAPAQNTTSIAPAAAAAPAKIAVPQKQSPQQQSPSLAKAKAKVTKVADAPALGKGSGDGDDIEGVTEGRFPEPDREEMYKQEPEECTTKTNKESASQRNFTRIANLTPKSKAWLKRYWSMIYPSSYADHMTQDK